MHALALTAPRAHRTAVGALLYHHVKPTPTLQVDIPVSRYEVELFQVVTE